MGIEVLGPVVLDGVDGLGLRDRVVLQALVVSGDEVVDKHVLADALWGDDEPPASWPKVVQGCIALLRKLLPNVLTWDLRAQHLLDVACDLAGRNITEEDWKNLVGKRPYHATCPGTEGAGNTPD